MKYLLLLLLTLLQFNAKAEQDHLDIINKKHNFDVHFEEFGKNSEGAYYLQGSDWAYSYQINEKSGIDFGKHAFNNGISFDQNTPREQHRIAGDIKDGLPSIKLQNYYLHYKHSIFLDKDTRLAIGPLAYFRKVNTYTVDREAVINNYSDSLFGVGMAFQNDDFLPWDWFFQYELKLAYGGRSGNSVIDSEILFLRKITGAIYGGFGAHLQKHEINNDYTHGKFHSYSLIATLGATF